MTGEALRVNEREFQAQVINYARLMGWRVHHFRPARTEKGWRTPVEGDPGFCDLVLVRDRVVFVELKAERGRLTHDQVLCLQALQDAGSEVHIWRPKDWATIQQTLKR